MFNYENEVVENENLQKKVDETGAVELDVVKIEHNLKSTSSVINFYNTTCRIMINGQAYIDVAVDIIKGVLTR